MEEWNLAMIHPDLDVCDLAGDKVGTVARVHAQALVSPAAGENAAPALEGYLEVKTGLLGLGPRYFVPTRFISDVTAGGVFLSVPKDALDANGWQQRPVGLEG
jgi:hypothetical protein